MPRAAVRLHAEMIDFSESGSIFTKKADLIDSGVTIAYDVRAETALILADALNVHEATGLTPSQLLQKTGGSTATAPITRLDWLGEEGMKEFDDGEYVFYADHQQTVAQLQARVAELEAALRELLSSTSLKELGESTGFRDLLVTGDDIRAGFKALGEA